MAATIRNVDSAGPRAVFVSDVKSGPLLTTAEWRKLLGRSRKRGTLLRIHNEAIPKTHSIAARHRAVYFTCVCFSKEMAPLSESQSAAGPSLQFVLAALDQRGSIYAFDVMRNKFWLIGRSGISGSCLVFNPVRRRELIVGLSDNSILCYNIDTCQLICKLPVHHTSPTTSLSPHPTLPLLISSSESESILWDSETWTRKRLLVGANSGIRHACFSATGSSIITAFADATIILWDPDTFLVQWNINLGTLLGKDIAAESQQRSSLAVSSNGELMAYAPFPGKVYVWHLVERRLLHEITVPTLAEDGVVQMAFLGASNIVGMLSDSGELIFVDVAEAKFVGQLSGGNKFQGFAPSPDGRILSAILRESRHIINLVGIDEILTEEADQVTVDVSLQQHAQQPTNPAHVLQDGKIPKKQALHDLLEHKESPLTLTRPRLLKCLHHYTSYPPQYRSLIWRILLRLPENRLAYEALLNQGPHIVSKNFRQQFPIKSDRVATSVERVLSALAFWSPVFQGMENLPAMVFPFVKAFLGDLFMAFEVILTVLLNWCQKWWEYYPHPPIECLVMIEDLLRFHDGALLDHFTRHEVTSQGYAWTILRSLFSSILSTPDWLTLWDHFVSNPPEFMYFFLIAYLKAHRIGLLALTKKEDFEFFFTHQMPTWPLSTILTSAYKLGPHTPSSLRPKTYIKPFAPLPKGDYPIYNAYPSFIVNYQSRLLERIKQEEAEKGKGRWRSGGSVRAAGIGTEERKLEDREDAMNEMVEDWWGGALRDAGKGTARGLKTHLGTSNRQAPQKSGSGVGDKAQTQKFIHSQMVNTRKHYENLAKVLGTHITDADAEARRQEDQGRQGTVAGEEEDSVQEQDEWARMAAEMRDIRFNVLRSPELGSSSGGRTGGGTAEVEEFHVGWSPTRPPPTESESSEVRQVRSQKGKERAF
ncbi:uncharacterized protein EV422DRAFT_544488 [Fimicolochytrium jonesii]|uniref:uncharacterized protein n=1 Tax=Fimicolochytrium jonesii TaxID=1396493 RepID=UPI0022FF24B5|nr:uncharacterized protein EV422DRAFT_544488 [Fimicolochytrium jonesii]KAI8816678.1 hypothetical protein EV422DRAFT_544488 [Fimicolochytrium jonesii]